MTRWWMAGVVLLAGCNYEVSNYEYRRLAEYIGDYEEWDAAARECAVDGKIMDSEFTFLMDKRREIIREKAAIEASEQKTKFFESITKTFTAEAQ